MSSLDEVCILMCTLIGHRPNSTTSVVDVAPAVRMVQGQHTSSAIMTKRKPVTYRHVASVAAAAAVAVVAAAAAAAAVRTSVLGVDSSETTRAGLVQPQVHLAARHPASYRPSLGPPD